MITLKEIDMFVIADETPELADAAVGLLRALKASQAREHRLAAVLANLLDWHATTAQPDDRCWLLAGRVMRQYRERQP